jgi:hypothetical protein
MEIKIQLEVIEELLQKIVDLLENGKTDEQADEEMPVKAPAKAVAASKSSKATQPTPPAKKSPVGSQKARSEMEALVRKVRDVLGHGKAKELISDVGEARKLSEIDDSLVGVVAKMANSMLNSGEDASDEDDFL